MCFVPQSLGIWLSAGVMLRVLRATFSNPAFGKGLLQLQPSARQVKNHHTASLALSTSLGVGLGRGCGQRENNRFLFIAWSGLPLTLREPLRLQDVLPRGQKQVVCAVAAEAWGTKLMLTQGGSMPDSKGRGLCNRVGHFSQWKESVLCDFQGNSVWLQHPSSSEAGFAGQGRTYLH